MLNERILSANWIKIKLSDQVEIRRKIEHASISVQAMIECFFYQLPKILTFILTIGTIFYLCPVATIVIAIAYVCSYRFYLSKKSNDLLAVKLKFTDMYTKLNSKYSRATENMFEYVIHHEKKKIIDITNELKIDMEKRWSLINYLYDQLSFEENVVGHLCTFSALFIYVTSNGTNVFIIPLYHYLKTLTSSIDDILVFYIQCLRFTEDYMVIIPILEEYEERVNVEQVDLKNEIQIEDLSFKYKDAREMFHLTLNGLVTFKVGQTILVTGKSGAGKIDYRLEHKIFFFQFQGKSTFYDILIGSIPMKDYQVNLWIDQQHPATLHSIERSRTMVMQDSQMDYRSTIFSMITDIDEDTAKQRIDGKVEMLVWHFLRLIDMEDFVRHDLKGNLDEPLENKLSGGQKTRLLLARALFRAHNRHSSMLILDEPDKGLPAETTVSIIENIIDWYRPKGILFLTLHTEKAHTLHFDQVLHIENGNITKVK
jgi:ABC-type transport system involved in cytochrome bd biosynthesis fused ATPase/permease subunit